jgi:magnesium transporter
VLRPTPATLSSRLLEERPANLPSHLYVTGGRPLSQFCVVVFTADGPRLEPLQAPEQLARLRELGRPLWLRVMGLSQPEAIRAMLAQLAVPEALLPPLLEIPQRPRVDCVDRDLLVVLHRLSFARDPSHLISSQLGLLLLPNLLVSFEESHHGDAFPELLHWLRSQVGTGDQGDLANIMHLLIDEVLDELHPMLEQIANRLDDLEAAALRDPKPKLLTRAFGHRSNLRRIRGQIWPLRHQIKMVLRQGQDLLGDQAWAGFTEMGELVELLFGNCELLRHQCDAITQTYAASVGNRMNQVMKTLTILTSIFAPLTFIGGIYGMNFEYMPELKWRLGYAYALTLMASIAVIQSWWLWRRGWFQDWTTPR